ncbi:histidine kinase dimerization/phosphoacceptor domain -containing protein [Rhodoplanes sp. TEM]|uniref:histidine kinase n=1 Tax=Rhodoplanes tepidamans TaxID=200616 RepID=A0ABT5J978_RHOTP|nr:MULTISPECIES: histidine kinase dimerization/phosphoacceptor domain -containing protein [Rhodoplanes]MDC7786162.1 histidine kinase dimerization/phosphoacceptor domain -containing protein [Rhodoplanes tepidamans]MDC7982829.1 histidine kinase dimerization/phosphoacceptor domain -containing protein [Rhodoplanes sp. TEM]MDQ0357173.1 two-component sensor histidine kinase/CheY-like chemotaxis protein [Rhodoplanes tepidamans]
MPNSSVTVLHVDDDSGLARLVQKALGRRGYVVERVTTAEEGFARLARGGIDVIVLDHFLPTGTGLDVLAALKDTPAPPPVVYVTASGEAAVAVAALKAGAADYVSKSVGEEFLTLLESAIDQALEKARLAAARDRAEREMREAKEHAEVLLHEVNHRVANSLALVAALVHMQAKEIADPAAQTALREVQARIMAIAGVHRRLYDSGDVRSVEISEYLGALLGDLEATMKASGHAATLSLSAAPVRVPTDKAVSIGVVVTELVTNAFKYAYPADRGGEIRVRFERSGDGRVALRVEDDGIGWRGEGPTKGTGMGSRIVAAMARGLGSEVAYPAPAGPRSGCCVSLEFEV